MTANEYRNTRRLATIKALDALLDDCSQVGTDHQNFVRVSAVRSYVGDLHEIELDDAAAHVRNGHRLDLREDEWRCLVCGHRFETSADADALPCPEVEKLARTEVPRG